MYVPFKMQGLPSPSLNKYHAWATLTEGEGKRRARDLEWKSCQSSVTLREEGRWDSRWQEMPGFSTAYVLLPCLHSPHNVLHSPSIVATYLPAFCWEEKDEHNSPSLHTYITTPVKFLRPTPSLSSSPFSPPPQHLSILYSLCHHWQQYQFVRSAFNQTLDTHQITGDYCRDYWRLLEITGDYCTDYWRLLEITVEITGDHWTDYWRLLEITVEIL